MVKRCAVSPVLATMCGHNDGAIAIPGSEYRGGGRSVATLCLAFFVAHGTVVVQYLVLGAFGEEF